MIEEKDMITFISPEMAWKYRIIPWDISGEYLTLLVDEQNLSEEAEAEVELITGYRIKWKKEPGNTIDQYLSKVYRRNGQNTSLLSADSSDDFLLKIIFEARDLRSSDIHIESYANKCRIRFRIDGKLIERYNIPLAQYPSFVNKIKIRSKLDISEKRLPQDGRILISNVAGHIDIRVSILPSLYGEKIVLRLLNNDSSQVSLEKLGLNKRQLEDYSRVLKRPYGIILISGPTGSGKTTTLYATLKLLNDEHVNILTVEDPIEYTLEGVNQVQMKESIGLTFASVLRTFLRQDPDIIMIGEIRDPETAQMAIRAALTGHLVLSTIHTNSAWGTISRLVDMGIPPYLLASTINVSIAQRLVRKLCLKCKLPVPYAGDGKVAGDDIVLEEGEIVFEAHGCDYCFHTGYSGRIAIYEVIPTEGDLSNYIKDNIQNIDQYMNLHKIQNLKKSAFDLVRKGETSLEEVYPILLNH